MSSSPAGRANKTKRSHLRPFCFISAVQRGGELTEVSLTASERQAGACRLPQAMSAAAAKPVPPSFCKNDFIISKGLFGDLFVLLVLCSEGADSQK